jgi:hypothetical protein
MSWIENDKPTPFDEQPVEGLFFLSGNQIAYELKGHWVHGQKYPMIAFPSGEECALWPAGNPEAISIVHVFGELDLPLADTRDEAFERASSIAEQCGYLARKVREGQLEVWGHDEDEHFLLTYDDDQRRLADVEVVKDDAPRPPEPLLDEKSQERLPELYANEELGLEAQAQVKFFTPDAAWWWYGSEFDGDDIFFGLVVGHEIELGYFSLKELQSVRGPLGLPIERDRWFEPTSLRELKAQHEEMRRGE